MSRILVLDPSPTDAVAVGAQLLASGMEVYLAPHHESARAAARAGYADVIVMDCTASPDTNLVTEMRREAETAGILVLSGRHDLGARLDAFAQGADDYVVKPCEWPDVAARVGALLRRRAPAATNGADVLRIGELTFFPRQRRVQRNGEDVRLRPREFDLLMTLVTHRDRVVSRAELLRTVWGYDSSTVTRTVDSHVLSVRRKLEPEPHRPRYVVTVSRVGYRFGG